MAISRRVVQISCARAALVAIAVGAILVAGDDDNHMYKQGEAVKVWLNKVGPYENPHETYAYYTLPYCRDVSKELERKGAGLGEAIEGSDMVLADYQISFKQNVEPSIVCSMELDENDAQTFENAITGHYWYQMVVDDLPVWGMVGEDPNSSDDEEEDTQNDEQADAGNENNGDEAATDSDDDKTSEPDEGDKNDANDDDKTGEANDDDKTGEQSDDNNAEADSSSSADGADDEAGDDSTANGRRLLQSEEKDSEGSDGQEENDNKEEDSAENTTEDDSESKDGENKVEEVSIYTHRHFDIAYNGERIIEVNLSSSNLVAVKPNTRLDFSFSVTWKESEVDFDDRFGKYLDDDFFEHQIHWFSILNSFMMVFFLAGFVALILMRTLKNDYARFARLADEEDFAKDMGDDSGWKQVQGDVFRMPTMLPALAALTGTGVQIAVVLFFVSIVAAIGSMHEERGYVTTSFVVSYAFASVVSGYVSGSLYNRSKGKQWIKTYILTCTLFPITVFSIGLTMNFVAIGYSSLSAIPFGTMVIIFLLWSLLSCPLALAGTLLGRNAKKPYLPPCRINTIPRSIPPKQWVFPQELVILAGGVLPFGSIFIEMYFIFTSFWNYKFYYVYGFVVLVLAILIIVVSCVAIVVTYVTLNAEDHRWQWPAFLSGASTSLYVLLYSGYYFLYRTKMYGLLQTVFYMGYSVNFSLGVACLCGAVGYLAADRFVRRIYSNIKSD